MCPFFSALKRNGETIDITIKEILKESLSDKVGLNNCQSLIKKEKWKMGQV